MYVDVNVSPFVGTSNIGAIGGVVSTVNFTMLELIFPTELLAYTVTLCAPSGKDKRFTVRLLVFETGVLFPVLFTLYHA